jgi:peptide alpha-N-acetyltransferase
MRDISGFIESRRKILITRPTMRVSWVAFAFANYLGEYYGVAYDTVARYLDNISTSERGEKYEESELMLFQNKCLEQQGKYEEGLQHLITNSKIIVDKYAMKIKSAEYSLKLRNYEDDNVHILN